MHQSLNNNLNHCFLKKICQDCLDLQNTLVRKDKLNWEALEEIFGFFQVAYKSMVYFANFQYILFPVRTYFLYNDTSSSRFAIRGGTTGKSCEGWTYSNGNPRRVCVSPRFAIRGHSALWYARQGSSSFKKERIWGWTLSMQRLDAWVPFL
jgi:hypothetical protein